MTVTGLGKKHRLQDLQERLRYTALRSVIANRAVVPFRRLRSPFAENPQPTSEDFWAVKDETIELQHLEAIEEGRQAPAES